MRSGATASHSGEEGSQFMRSEATASHSGEEGSYT